FYIVHFLLRVARSVNRQHDGDPRRFVLLFVNLGLKAVSSSHSTLFVRNDRSFFDINDFVIVLQEAPRDAPGRPLDFIMGIDKT
ncbi:MAG: hypothetical protein SOR89_02615, partial [Ndongobacter sp.]|nr:hypothetical protein [Ndongobacter sp.]